MDFENIVQTYGYLAVFLGACVEGEVIVSLSGYLASSGYLNIWDVILVAFIGTLLADQASYYFGRWYGPKIFEKYPSLKEKSGRVFSLLRKYETIFIMSFRFIYGIRVISPIIIGASGVNPKKFAILNFPAAAIWSVAIAGAGFLGGKALMALLEKFGMYQKYIFIGGAIFIVVFMLALHLYKHFKKSKL